MRWFRADGPNREWIMRHLNAVLDTLIEAGMDSTPGRVEDLLNARGIPVEITKSADGFYVVRAK